LTALLIDADEPNAIRQEVMMPAQSSEKEEVKMYSDFKSPYAFLAFDPGMMLGQRFDVRVRWIPFQLRVKGKGERSVYSEYKVKYSYLDARRWAKPRGLWIRGPLKIYDTTPAAIGGLFAETRADYSTSAGWPSKNSFFVSLKPISRKL
jgi:2-hydroxychromene-2-carboxylate isomerase